MNSLISPQSEVVFAQSFPIHYHELDMHGRVRPVTLLNYMQDAAGLHATKLGIAVGDLRKQGLTWVISRLHLIVERYPRANESLTVRTWPSTREGIFSCREFELSDGATVGRATSSWAVLNLATRRPVRLEDHLPPYPLLGQRLIDDDFTSLPLLDRASSETEFRVLRADLDINQHVNNAVFSAWALETVPDMVAAKSLTELEISFRAEALYGESVLSRCQVHESDADYCCLHQVLSSRDGRELARLRTRWSDITERL